MLNRIKIRIVRWILRKYINKKNLLKCAKWLFRKVDEWSMKSESKLDDVVATHMYIEFDIERDAVVEVPKKSSVPKRYTYRISGD